MIGCGYTFDGSKLTFNSPTQTIILANNITIKDIDKYIEQHRIKQLRKQKIIKLNAS